MYVKDIIHSDVWTDQWKKVIYSAKSPSWYTIFHISTTKNEIKDFGVMGLGFRPGNACVASSFRLSKQNKLDQLFKVAIHELGHTQGLPHCEVKTCFMRDAEGKNQTNDEKEFCSSCKIKLEKKGWVF